MKREVSAKKGEKRRETGDCQRGKGK